MSSGPGDRVFKVQQSLFGNADQSALPFYAGENILDNSSALIQHHFQLKALFAEPLDDVVCTGAVDFLTA